MLRGYTCSYSLTQIILHEASAYPTTNKTGVTADFFVTNINEVVPSVAGADQAEHGGDRKVRVRTQPVPHGRRGLPGERRLQTFLLLQEGQI